MIPASLVKLELILLGTLVLKFFRKLHVQLGPLPRPVHFFRIVTKSLPPPRCGHPLLMTRNGSMPLTNYTRLDEVVR